VVLMTKAWLIYFFFFLLNIGSLFYVTTSCLLFCRINVAHSETAIHAAGVATGSGKELSYKIRNKLVTHTHTHAL
jgi:hypothetical protein